MFYFKSIFPGFFQIFSPEVYQNEKKMDYCCER